MRRNAAQQLAELLGGRIQSMYYAFGDTDVDVIAEMPDHTSVAAISLALAASGAFSGSTTVLLKPEEMDQTARKSPAYRTPGK